MNRLLSLKLYNNNRSGVSLLEQQSGFSVFREPLGGTVNIAAGYWPYSGLWQYSFPDGAWLALVATVLLLVAVARSYRKGEYRVGIAVGSVAAIMWVAGAVTIVCTDRILARGLSTIPYGVFPFRSVLLTVIAVAAIAISLLLAVLFTSFRQRNTLVTVACFLAVPAAFALLMQARLMLVRDDQADLWVTCLWLVEAVFVAIVVIWLVTRWLRKHYLAQGVTD